MPSHSTQGCSQEQPSLGHMLYPEPLSRMQSGGVPVPLPPPATPGCTQKPAVRYALSALGCADSTCTRALMFTQTRLTPEPGTHAAPPQPHLQDHIQEPKLI